MKKFKKTLSTLLVITVVASILIAGTLAYLTKDAGKATNVFSVGDIDVTLDEEVAVIGQGGEVKEVEDGAKYEGIMPGDYLQKEVTVTNNGSTPAYVAVTVDVNNFSQIRDAIESYGEDDENAEDMLDYVFDGWGLTVKDRFVGVKKDMSYKVNEFVDSSILHVDSAKRIVASEVAHFSMNNWFKSEAEAKATGYTVAGTENSFYLEYAGDYSLRFTYYIHLNGGASATLFKGLNVPAEFDADQMKMFDELKINVSAKAIQADNMGIAEAYKNEDESTAKAKTAFAILHGLVSEDEVNVNNNPLPPAVEVSEDGKLTLEEGEAVTVTGSLAQTLTVSGEGTLYLSKASVTAVEGNALELAEDADVKVVIDDDTTLKAAAGGSGIYVPAGTTLDLSGDGDLTAIGGGGSDSANGGNGIGGEGTIRIHDLDGLVAEGYGKAGFGIGGATDSITITDTTIESVKGGYVQKNCAEDDLWDKKSPEGAPAIGSMKDGAVITLNNVTIENALGGGKSAGIGARYWTGVTVNISDSTIKNVVGGTGSAGIGGSHPSKYDAASKPITITITNSTINAEGGQYGAGIGSGYDTYCHAKEDAPMTTITIDGASVISAKGGKMAAGIGTGHNAINFTNKIDKEFNAANVKADTSEDVCCLGAECTVAQDIGLGALKKSAFGIE